MGKITLGLSLIIAVLAMIAHEYIWLKILLVGLAVFLIIWGREQRQTETFIGRLPGGKYALKVLRQIELVIEPRDQEHEHYIKDVIVGYGNDLRASLRTVLITRNSSRILAHHLDRFTTDGLIEYPQNGPGWIKPDLRYIVTHTLDELGI
jgi:hypothetical protein